MRLHVKHPREPGRIAACPPPPPSLRTSPLLLNSLSFSPGVTALALFNPPTPASLTHCCGSSTRRTPRVLNSQGHCKYLPSRRIFEEILLTRKNVCFENIKKIQALVDQWAQRDNLITTNATKRPWWHWMLNFLNGFNSWRWSSQQRYSLSKTVSNVTNSNWDILELISGQEWDYYNLSYFR